MRNSKARILLVEDDKNLGFVIKDFLQLSGYEVSHQENGIKGLEAYQKYSFDLILLDVMMPMKDGFTMAQEIRKNDKTIPIIFVTAKSLKEDAILGLKIGADDYITKPFSTEELLLRIGAVLRRSMPSSSQNTDVYQLGKLIFDSQNMVIRCNENEQKLTKTEAALLQMLSVNINTVVKREELLKSIWGENDYFMGRSMDVYITRLRKYLRHDPNLAIINIHNTGFKLELKA
jgi:DNA-binding response OmpR family regulator